MILQVKYTKQVTWFTHNENARLCAATAKTELNTRPTGRARKITNDVKRKRPSQSKSVIHVRAK